MKSSKPRGKRSPMSSAVSAASEERAFAEVVEMIQAARGRAVAAVNTALIDLYWRVGEYISRKLETAAWGEGVVDELARYIQRRQPNLRGFTRRNLFRMRQFFEAYTQDEKVSALLTQLPWTQRARGKHHEQFPEEAHRGVSAAGSHQRGGSAGEVHSPWASVHAASMVGAAAVGYRVGGDLCPDECTPRA